MAIKLIALDIDGTLLNSRGEVSAVNQAAIAEATRRGIEVALVTGRRYDFAMLAARQIASPLTMIVNNGAMVKGADGKTHMRHLLARETAREVLQRTREWRMGASVIFDREKINQVMMERIDFEDGIRGKYYWRNREFLGESSPLEDCLADEDPIQIMFSGGVLAMREAEGVLRGVQFNGQYGGERIGKFALAVTAYEDKDFSMIDVIHPKVTKGATLSEWAGVQGVAREKILAIGDNHNDLEMLNFAGRPVVMGNAVTELKGYGWHETHSNDEDGVAAAIERFALRETD
jgi:hydroxymethylpyrimidine pyrophosphatase-like HAD family hydrolase